MRLHSKILLGFLTLALLPLLPGAAQAQGVYATNLAGFPCETLGTTRLDDNQMNIIACLKETATTTVYKWQNMTFNFNASARYAIMKAYKYKDPAYDGLTKETAYQIHSYILSGPAEAFVPNTVQNQYVVATIPNNEKRRFYLLGGSDISPYGVLHYGTLDGVEVVYAACNAALGWRIQGAWSFTGGADTDVIFGTDRNQTGLVGTNDLFQDFGKTAFQVTCVKFDGGITTNP